MRINECSRTQQHERPVIDKHNKRRAVTKVYFLIRLVSQQTELN